MHVTVAMLANVMMIVIVVKNVLAMNLVTVDVKKGKNVLVKENVIVDVTKAVIVMMNQCFVYLKYQKIKMAMKYLNQLMMKSYLTSW